jgi:methyl-accepting chemotaxis protein
MKKIFDNMKIKTEVIVSFTAVLILALFVGLVGFWGLMGIKQSSHELYKFDALDLQYSGQASTYFQQLQYNVLKMKTITSQADYEATLQSISDFKDLTDNELKTFQSNIDADKNVPEELVTLFSALMANWDLYSSKIDEYFVLLEGSDTVAISDVRLFLADLGPQVRDQFLQLMALAAQDASSSAENNNKNAMLSMIIMGAVLLVALIIATILQSLIVRSIVGPIITLSRISDKLAEGDVDIEASVSDKDLMIADRKDELGKLATAFTRLIEGTREQVNAAQLVAAGDLTTKVNVRSEKDVLGKALSTLVGNLSSIVSSVISAADQVTNGSVSLSNSSMALSQGATEQASSVEELTASIEEVAAQTEINSKNADKANELASKAKRDAENGNIQMNAMLKAMDEINAASANINKIIKVIDDIAFQTNILALNAAVEAARAGQHGLGFAVVAEEVRTLAAKSANAANETTELIEDSIYKVESGIKIANETAKALTSIVNGVEKAADLVSDIAAASKEQSAAIEQINQGVMQISQVVQTNAATSEESAAASQELSGQAAQLKELVNTFKINVEGQSAKKTLASVTADIGKKSAASYQPAKPKISLDIGEFGKY